MSEPWRILGRILLLRCPRCGASPVYTGMFTMRSTCRGCSLRFEREPGYFIGAIYLNYGLTAGLMIGGYFALERFTSLEPASLLMVCAAVGVVVPILFFRHARLLWLGVDLYIDPP